MTLKVAYLINRYPKISHAFIRREILALERQGVEIERIRSRVLSSSSPSSVRGEMRGELEALIKRYGLENRVGSQLRSARRSSGMRCVARAGSCCRASRKAYRW